MAIAAVVTLFKGRSGAISERTATCLFSNSVARLVSTT